MKGSRLVFIAGILVGVVATWLLGSSVRRWMEDPSGTADPAAVKMTAPLAPSQNSADSRTRESTPRPGPLPADAAPGAAPRSEAYTAAEDITADSPGADADRNANMFYVDPYILRSQFPENRALPPVDAAEMEQKRSAREERNRLYGKIAANQATPAEIQSFYSEQERLALDSIQLLEYVLQTYGGEMSERDLKKHEFLLAQFKKRLEAIPRKEFEAMERLKDKTQNE